MRIALLYFTVTENPNVLEVKGKAILVETEFEKKCTFFIVDFTLPSRKSLGNEQMY
jgi:hypothetical protein